MFFIFIKACNKYKFSFVLNTYGETSITLKPNNTFENIYVYEGNFHKLFVTAIKKMKMYRKNGGRL